MQPMISSSKTATALIGVTDPNGKETQLIVVSFEIDGNEYGLTPASAITMGQNLLAQGERAVQLQATLSALEKHFPQIAESDPNWRVTLMKEIEAQAENILAKEAKLRDELDDNADFLTRLLRDLK